MLRTHLAPLRPLAALTVAAGLLVAPAAAFANGRFPTAGQIALDPSDPAHILVRATYGLLVTHDSGANWWWICEQAVGYGGAEDPFIAITKDGTLLAGVFEGLAVGHQGGCEWAFANGSLDQRFAIDVAIEPNDPSHGVVLVSNSADGGAGAFITQVWQTGDNGTTWAQAGTSLPSAMLGLTLDPAPSDPQRIYVSGRLGAPAYAGVLQRSKDGGGTWENLPIPGSSDMNLPYIAAIDPKNPDIVYVRLNGVTNDRLLVSKDGGATWTTIFTATGNLLGFALSPDGATVAVGGTADGLWTAPSSSLAFKKVSKIGPKCLAWSANGLYVCADEFKDGFTAGISTDSGVTFTSIMHLHQLNGPLACDPSSTTGKTCPALWPAIQLALGGTMAGDAGPTSSASASSGSTTGGPSPAAGCSCSTPGVASAALLPAGALAALALVARRRRSLTLRRGAGGTTRR